MNQPPEHCPRCGASVAAGSDATDAKFVSPEAFAESESTVKWTHVERFGDGDFQWILDGAKAALETHGEPVR